jgi:lactoylglutathione lyase
VALCFGMFGAWKRGTNMIDRLWYATIFVKNFKQALEFYRDTLGLPLRFAHEDYGHASFATEGALFSLQRVEKDQESFSGRHTGVGFGTKDLDTEYERLKAKGVEFTQVPTKMSWGGYMSLFRDPDGNVLYLDQLR